MNNVFFLVSVVFVCCPLCLLILECVPHCLLSTSSLFILYLFHAWNSVCPFCFCLFIYLFFHIAVFVFGSFHFSFPSSCLSHIYFLAHWLPFSPLMYFVNVTSLCRQGNVGILSGERPAIAWITTSSHREMRGLCRLLWHQWGRSLWLWMPCCNLFTSTEEVRLLNASI